MPRIRKDRVHPPPLPKRSGVNPATSEVIYTDEEREFLAAVERYKKLYRRPFPTWHEILEVVLAMGYRRVAEPVSLESLPRARDCGRPKMWKGGAP